MLRNIPWAVCVFAAAIAGFIILIVPVLTAAEQNTPLIIPRLEEPPALDDFLEMKPRGGFDGKLAKVEGFIQARPSDGQPASQRTEAYLGYDDQNLYVVFVALDSDPEKIRARMVPREQFVDRGGRGTDDLVSVSLDTFSDRRRGYVFQVNPHGIQWDALYTEGGGFDTSFDTLWHSRGKITDRGYVVWIAIPFRSLRFPDAYEQQWGILLNRDIPRTNEASYWPRFTSRIQGFINQSTPIAGLAGVSPGRNLQFIPYGVFRSFRALDLRPVDGPRYVDKSGEGDGGIDAKIVFKDSLVLDLTVNPDFSQVESDEPQVTVNQRFELYFPEKRPFFIENAGYFQTPASLVFTRRIADPRFGARLTGKVGRFAIGGLLTDDEAPGKSVAAGSPLEGTRATFGVVRVSRDILDQSSIGMIYTHRAYEGRHNSVGGIDARLRLTDNWTADMQAVASRTSAGGGQVSWGSAYDFSLNRSGRQFNHALSYQSRNPEFETLTGFVPRTDIHQVFQATSYDFRPEGKYLIAWGPRIEIYHAWDYRGVHLNWLYSPGFQAEFAGQTFVWANYSPEFELLRARDHWALSTRRSFHRRTTTVGFRSNYLKKLGVESEFRFGQRVNLDPLASEEPDLAGRASGNFTLTLRPLTPLRIDNTYLLFRLTDRRDGASIYNNHILRSKWNWQFSRELSMRVILQYDALLANPARTWLRTSRNFNADLLFTYLLNPGTALYVGYNSNLGNLELVEDGGFRRLVRTDELHNDARGFFVKLSYLFRY